MKKVNIYILKKKKYSSKEINLINKISPVTGDILFIKFISLDRDAIYKYKIYGVCIGKKKSLIMTTYFLRTIICGSSINLTFYRHSPFIFEIKLYKQGQKRPSKFKMYNFAPKLRVYQKLLTDIDPSIVF